ncbi:MAG: hypothetical protein AUJ74_01600 [Candidatus Omnitrophica bacterium CG1_02_44_16]|nr:MAG: hypothetical protein AUJ74_01600 [Candidatus Omnitrophica bacterium CG1_02_44_16]
MPLARRIIFYIFVVLYLVLCPILVLYTLGFILNPKEGEWVHTGLIHFSTIPEGANVYLGKSRFIHFTPTVIQELISGSYDIAIRHKGYKAWEHTVWLDAGKAIAFDNIMLVPNVWGSQALSQERFSQIHPLDGTDIMLVCKGPTLGECLVYDRKKEKAIPLLSYGSKFYDFQFDSVFTSKKSHSIVLYGGPIWGRKYLFLGLGNENEDGLEITDITKFFPARPVDIVWESGKDKVLFAVYQEYINRLDIKTGEFYPRYVENVAGYGLYGRRLYYLDKNKRIMRLSADAQKDERIFFRHWFEQQKNREIVFENYLIGKGGRGALYNEDSDYLLAWTRREIIANAQLLHKEGIDIEKCFWAKDGHRVIFKDGEMVYLLEIEPQGKNHVDWVVKVKKGTSVAYIQETGYLYYLSDNEGILSRILIAPPKKVSSQP